MAASALCDGGAELDIAWLDARIETLSAELGEPDVAERYARAKRDADLS